MVKIYRLLSLVVMVIALSGCGLFEAEVGIEKDRAEQKKVLDGLFVTYWRGAKISLRSVPVSADTETIDFEKIKRQQQEELHLGKHLGRIFDWENILRGVEKEEKQRLSAKEFMELAQEVYEMADAIETKDEDTYPTFMELLHHSSRILRTDPIEMPENWSNSTEHWLFALALESNFGFGSWKTYELDRVHPEEMATSDYRVAANLHKGLDHLRNQWYYLADEEFSQAIAESNAPNITLNKNTEKLLVEQNFNELAPREQFKLVALASSHLLRGFSRHQSGDDALQRKAMEDISAAVSNFKNLGIDNELVWLAESYVYIQNDEKEKAIASLTRLEGSSYMSDKEKKLIAGAKEHIQNRDPDSALNFLTDRVMMYKLGLSYARSYTAEIEWMQLLEKTEYGQRILKRFSELEQTFNKAKGYLSLDGLKDRGQALFNELKEKGDG
ncbi:MAG: hypothetical protein P8166_15080 [Candidatus Thiodiazotropha sp.]